MSSRVMGDFTMKKIKTESEYIVSTSDTTLSLDFYLWRLAALGISADGVHPENRPDIDRQQR